MGRVFGGFGLNKLVSQNVSTLPRGFNVPVACGVFFGLGRRCRHDIAASILGAVVHRGEARLSRIALEAGLPFDRARRIVEDMVSSGLLYYNPSSQSYGLTPAGYEWLYLYQRLEEKYSPPVSTPMEKRGRER